MHREQELLVLMSFWNQSMEQGDIPRAFINQTEKLEELEQWKEKVDKAEKEKADMLLLKLAADEERRIRQEKLDLLKHMEEKKAKEKLDKKLEYQRMFSEINDQNNALRGEIKFLKEKLAVKNAKCEELAQRYQLKKCIPKKKVKFTRLEKTEDEVEDMLCLFHIASKLPLKLCQGEALITFEEADVAKELIKQHHHTVSLENEMVVLRAYPIVQKRGVTFELHAKISLKRINVFNIPNLKISEEWMRDKLELNFYINKLGGGIQHVAYNQQSQMALVTFAEPIAVNNIVRYRECPFYAHGNSYSVSVSPAIQRKLERFQVFSGVSKRTILLSGIKASEEDEENVQDMIAIHFQKPSNGGGEVENIKYVSKGTKVVYFENDGEIK
ncbi:N-myc-interactor isoform X2 [Hemicordylus capensis]|uniref:N-myc-interactor isoform X2 n=1 Tax=Hemicordylus capensis TaxID=884348 RepID=UPI002303A035|nr:N-myc-interactor isoform X2 [Hemicordylus capensis]XP_053123343.1 N-myc-interactor isoform X2 [Hemicordylus capensis]XP_053123351.1 N-myc-interactor isoform X2 [Hemicordylus capensis]